MSDIAKWNGIAVAGIAKWNGIAVAGIGKFNGVTWPAAGLPLHGWTYRKPFALSRASGAVTNYQMKLLVGESAGTTIGSDLVSNGGFASNTTGWTASTCSLASVAGGQSGNCLQITRTSGASQVAYQDVPVVVGKTYLVSCYVKSGISGDQDFWFRMTDAGELGSVSSQTTSSWLLKSVVIKPTTTPVRVALYKISDTAGTMLFDTVSLIEIPNVYCDSSCASDFDDIRFTKSDGTTLLDYWIESISGTTPNQTATIWVEFDSIGTTDTTFYVYYGNSGAAAYSNGANTFIVFDDFERGSNGDTIGGSWTEATAHVHISTEQEYTGITSDTRSAKIIGGTDANATIPVTASDNISIQFQAYKENTGDLAVIHNDDGSRVQFYWSTDETLKYFSSAGSYVAISPAQSPAHSTWHLFEINNFIWGSNTYDLWLNGTKVGVGLSEYVDAYAAGKFWIRGSMAGGGHTWFDNFIVRNWRAVEPTWGTWGAQES